MNRIFTHGVEFNASWCLTSRLELAGGYQYLEAFDKEVLSSLNAGEIFRRNQTTGSTERVPRADYAGLSNRSRHMGNLKNSYSDFRLGFNVRLRGIYRGRFGIGDFTGHGYEDMDHEYRSEEQP